MIEERRRVNPLKVWSPSAVVVSLILFSGTNLLFCQESPALIPQSTTSPKTFGENARQNAAMPCLEPAPLPGLDQYDGPLKKTIGIFARALDRKAVHVPHYKPDAVLCSLKLGDKFLLFAEDSIDPVTFLGAGFDAGLDQASNRDPTFGQGAAGYAKRYGADLAGSVTSKFFKDFAYPAIFSEDPRYYRLGHGSSGKRLLHAAGHVFVAHHQDGTHMFNYSEWLGSTSSAVLNNVYHPGNEHGAWETAQRVGMSFVFDMGYDALREFWPEISRKLKLPFRGEPVPANPGLVPNQN